MRNKRQLLFIQGGGENVHDKWDDKLVRSLHRKLGDGFAIRYPRMPNEDDPDYALWRPVLEKELARLREGAILVGHSVGAVILVRLLMEHVAIRKPGGIFFIATPFLGDGGWPADTKFPTDLGTYFPQDVPIHFYHGLDDEIVPSSHAALFARAVPQAHVHYLSRHDHQLNNDLSEVAVAILSLEACNKRDGGN